MGENVDASRSTETHSPRRSYETDEKLIRRSGVKATGDKSNGFRYDGNENPKSLDWHSLSVRCEYLRDLKQNFESGLK